MSDSAKTTANSSAKSCSLPPRPTNPPPGYVFVREETESKSRKNSKKDSGWKHGIEIVKEEDEKEKKAYKYVLCCWCSKVTYGGVARLKHHLAGTRKDVGPCEVAPNDVKTFFLDLLNKGKTAKHLSQMEFNECVDSGSYFGSQGEANIPSGGSSRGVRGPMDRFLSTPVGDDDVAAIVAPQNPKEMRKKVCLDIGRFFFENAIAFNVVRSHSFINMCRSLGAFGRGFKPPTMHEMRTWILQEELNTTEKVVEEIKRTWPQTGVSIMSDGWQDTRNRSLINFLVNNPSGTVFLKCVDASEHVKDAKLLFKLLDEVVEEVGEEIVVQVVTDNASNYKKAGLMLMEKRKHLYWTPCAAHCLDLMLEKIGELPQHKNALLKAKKISNYIYNHSWVLSLMRKYTERELIRPAATRFATAFLTLQSILEVRQPLESMFTSKEWADSAFANKADGKEIRKIILKDNTFWRGVSYAIRSTQPLVEVLRLVDSEKEPAMAYLYNAMDVAKEKIARNLGGEEKDYKEIWEIIDHKWDYQMHRHLHAAAYYLNPRCHYSPDFSSHPEVKLGLLNCLDKLMPNRDEMHKADLQLDIFHKREGLFGYSQAKASVDKRSPVDWWTQFGDCTPELQKFAVKVLGLTCSSSGCERNWSTFNQVHTKRRNRLSTIRMNTLVFIMYNKRLKDRHLKMKALKNDEDNLEIDDLPSDDEWFVSENDETSPNFSLNEGDGGDGSQVERNEYSRKRKSQQVNEGSSKGKGKRQLIDEDDDDWLDIDNDGGEGHRMATIARYDDSFDDSLDEEGES